MYKINLTVQYILNKLLTSHIELYICMFYGKYTNFRLNHNYVDVL